MFECHVIRNFTVPSSPPRDVMVESHNPASLNVSWLPPPEVDHNGLITGYMINYTSNGTDDMMSVSVTSGTTHILVGLLGSTQYFITVAALNANGSGTFSNLTEGISGEPGELNS